MKNPRVYHVAEDIYCIYRASYYNCCYLINRNNRIVLIDSGMRSDGSEIFKACEMLGLNYKNISSIMLTHWHNDHSAGASIIKQLTNCKTYCHYSEKDFFEKKQYKNSLLHRISDFIPERGILVLFKGLLGESIPIPVNIDETVSDGDVIEDFFEVIETPGHTDGHIAFFDRKTKALFAGDAIAVIDGRIRYMAKPVTLNISEAKVSMLKLLNFDFNYLCPGHREPLVKNADSERRRVIEKLNTDKRWPLLG